MSAVTTPPAIFTTSQLQARLSQPPLISQGSTVAPPPPTSGTPPVSVISGNREQLRYLLQRGTTTTAPEFTNLMSAGTGLAAASVSLETPLSSTASPSVVALTTTTTTAATTSQGVTTSRVWVPGTATTTTLRQWGCW